MYYTEIMYFLIDNLPLYYPEALEEEMFHPLGKRQYKTM